MAESDSSAESSERDSAGLSRDTSRLVGLIAAVIAPVALVTALAYYFGWRRERAFAGYFGIDPSVLGLTSNDYVLRSVSALFLPFAVVLLLGFAFFCGRLFFTGREPPRWLAPLAGIVGVALLAVGIALASGHGVSSRFIFAQALSLAVGVALIAYALIEIQKRRSGREPRGASGLRIITLCVVLLGLFWATAEYADSRGAAEARKLAANLGVDPTVTIFSKQNLNVMPIGYGTDSDCPIVTTQVSRHTDFPYVYRGFTLLLRNGGDYFITPSPPDGVWTPAGEPVLIIPDNDTIRVELERGAAYPTHETEKTASGEQPAFTC